MAPETEPGTRPTELETLAVTGGTPNASSVGKVIRVPEPTTVLIAPAAAPAATGGSGTGRYPAPWPALEPYKTADVRPELWPREDNSFVLPLELRPRDEELGRVWMRDTYVNHFVVDGKSVYVCTGTTRVPGLTAAGPGMCGHRNQRETGR